MSVNYTTVVVSKPKRRQSGRKKSTKHNNAGFSVTYSTILHVVPSSTKDGKPEAEVDTNNVTAQKTPKPEGKIVADAATPQKSEPVDEQDQTATYRVVRNLPTQVNLVKGDEIVCTKYKEDEYFMKGLVKATRQPCLLPADHVERSSRSKYVFVVKSDYRAMDVRQGDLLSPVNGWLMGTVLRTTQKGSFPANYVERDYSRKGAFRAMYSFEATDDEDVSFEEGDLLISDVIFGILKRTGNICTLPMNILTKESDESEGELETDEDNSSSLLKRAVIVHDSPITKKLVLVGDNACGKTCLIYAISGDTIPDVYIPTVFDNYSTYVVAYGRKVDFGLWDTAGQEDYDRLRPLSYPQTEVYLVCYAVDSYDSLWNVKKKWIPEVRHHSPDVPIILVGMKSDLRDSGDASSKSNQQLVLKEDVSFMAKYIEAVEYLECSSKTKEGVLAVFEAAARAALLVDKQKKYKCTVQ